jgi:SAM-dependent methyltransferase
MSDESQEAKAYWSSIPFAYYHTDGPQRRMIVECVRELGRGRSIQSVLEFGCNVGRTLHLLSRSLTPSPRVVGLDINEAALEDGRRAYGLDLRLGSEEALSAIGDGEFDCAFTVSVFDHMPDRDLVRSAIDDLSRITKRYLLFLEPFDGRTERAASKKTDFNYYWDYPALLREAGLRIIHDLWFPLGYATPMQPRYRLYVVSLEPKAKGLSTGFVWKCRLERATWMTLNHPRLASFRR